MAPDFGENRKCAATVPTLAVARSNWTSDEAKRPINVHPARPATCGSEDREAKYAPVSDPSSPPAGLGPNSPPAGLGPNSPPAGLGPNSPPAGLGPNSPPAGLGPRCIGN